MSYKFAEHQSYAKFMMDCANHLLLAYAMGSGKTAIALWWIRDAIRSRKIEDALVICPASIVESWRQAIEDMIKFETFTEADVALLKEKVRITSFQKTYRSTKVPTNHRDGSVTYRKRVELRPEVDKYWGAIIVDESHNIGAHDSTQTKVALLLSRTAKYRFAMSGTPTHGGGGGPAYSKLYGQVQFLTACNAFKSWTAFCERYVATTDRWHNPKTYNNDLCENLLYDHGIVCRLEDCFDMPGMIEQDVPCPLAEPVIYRDIKEGRLDQYHVEVLTAGVQYTKMLQVCSGSLITDEGTMNLRTSKAEALNDLLNSTDDPIVIFCDLRASIDAVAKIVKKTGRSLTVFDGRSKGAVWKDFADGRTDTIICQYQSGGVGLNLQRAHIMILFEPCRSALLMEQAKGRIYRKGQDKKCVYYYLQTPKTIEEKVLSLVRSGVDATNEVLDEWSKGLY